MSWKEDQIEKVKEISSLIITLILDLGLIVICTYLLEYTRGIIEKVMGSPLNKADNWTFVIIYMISKFVIISGFVLYAIDDILSHVIRKYKKFLKK